MLSPEATLTSPLAAAVEQQGPLLALTVGWHPDVLRIGEQVLWADSERVLELSRYLPLFRRPGGDGLGLGYGGISREPLRIERDQAGGLRLARSPGRMAIEVDGQEIDTAGYIAPAQIEAGVVLVLGRAVVLCVHWVYGLPKDNPVDGWLGVGTAAIKTRDLIRQVARSAAPVLLLGETGTGKEVAARAIHALGTRAHAPLVSVNMAALSESLAAADLFGAARGAYTGAQAARAGLFAEAQDATLFLDEIGNTPAAVQPMLLRVLETGDYRPLGAPRDQHSNARVVAATDQDLHGAGFNQALLRRLEGFTIYLPPLRSRREDIGLLLAHLLAAEGQAGVVFPPALVARFVRYDWPGNVRQLKLVFRRCLLALQTAEVPDFDALTGPPPAQVATHSARRHAEDDVSPGPDEGTVRTARRRLADVDPQAVVRVMDENRWYIQRAARALGISRPSMYKLLAGHAMIRRAARIDAAEIRGALATCGGDLEACAAHLRTPTEALRRHVRSLADPQVWPGSPGCSESHPVVPAPGGES